MTLGHSREWSLSMCMCMSSHPLALSDPCSFEIFFVLCEASQLNGPWSGEASSVDLGVTPRQWLTGLYRKNKTETPRHMAPAVGGAWIR